MDIGRVLRTAAGVLIPAVSARITVAAVAAVIAVVEAEALFAQAAAATMAAAGAAVHAAGAESIAKTEEGTFVQLSATPYQFRDTVRFSNGRDTLLQELRCGQHVEVFSLSSDDFEHEEHKWPEEEYRHTFLGCD